jgi:hypothetical protein
MRRPWHARGIGSHIVHWQWQYRRTPSDPWTPFASSSHKVFTVLEVPKLPWQQQPYPDDQNPWIDVLDDACIWAAGHTTAADAAGAITTKVNEDLGLTYDMATGAAHYVLDSWFEARKFVDYLRTGAGLGNIVNCTDCASIVTTYANAVGCDLCASTMRAHFDLTRIKAIGQPAWGCPLWGCDFSYHEVAWAGGGHGEPIFDACLRVRANA